MVPCPGLMRTSGLGRGGRGGAALSGPGGGWEREWVSWGESWVFVFEVGATRMGVEESGGDQDPVSSLGL